MFSRWSLWGWILTRVAKAQGFMDPRILFTQVQRFSRPTEVWVPAELLRSGMVLQARGLLNTQAIQNNMDWVWPYWVHCQFDPTNIAFIPRAFSLTHINLTHRNWTGLGIPEFKEYPLVDPRGLVTPLFDGWSVDAWIIREKASSLIPSQQKDGHQHLEYENNLEVMTHLQSKSFDLQSRASVHTETGTPTCRISYSARCETKAWLVICIRPYNPEGISLIDKIQRLPLEQGEGWLINSKTPVMLRETPWHYIFSNYQLGDILPQITGMMKPGAHYEEQQISCSAGMATAGAVYELTAHQNQNVTVEIPIADKPLSPAISNGWNEHLQGTCQMEIPNKSFQALYDIALRTLILYSPEDIYPGPFTYKRFWFRDAAFIIYAMVSAGLTINIPKILAGFPKRQTPMGYYESQDGEWDSNGQAIWAIERFSTMTKTSISDELLASIERGAMWIKRKRVSKKVQSGHAGLFPAGFSAEHFGPSDFYYWDDFWGVAGLNAAAKLLKEKNSQLASSIQEEAVDFQLSIDQSLKSIHAHLEPKGIPASPYRRMDAGSIGSLIASYPLQIYPHDSPSMKVTSDFIMRKYMEQGTYYHELSHSGINIYLTLQLAQVLLRRGDPKFFDMVESVARLASPTGQWPEAIHPLTKGGCMGDGQHVWAAAEWIMMMRNMFVREEEEREMLILCSGIPKAWLTPNQHLSFGPTNTVYGKITVTIDVKDSIRVTWDAQWHHTAPLIEIHLEGFAASFVPKADVNYMQFNLDKKESL